MIDGNTLIAWGFKPSRWFKQGLETANAMRSDGANDDAIFAALQALQPVETLMRTNGVPFAMLIDADNELERANVAAVAQHMDALMRVPTIVAGAVMPDACPSGTALGTIPVGGVVACEDAIHPGFHSSDICCSVAVTVFARKDDPKRILDAVNAVTHFGPGGRDRLHQPRDEVMAGFEANPFLKGLERFAIGHFATQGDGNHFAYVGHLKSTGQAALVTHHGSRGFGAQLYKRGMAVAKRHTAIHAPKVPEHSAWIKASSDDGRAYWEALQVARLWTRANHHAIHDLAAAKLGNAVTDRFWNEHNFVFQKSDGLFYHGKGATPNWSGFSADDDGRTIVPLNMAEPVLILKHRDNKDALGFAPHGAGRNLGRKAFLRENRPELPDGIDARFYCGKPDLSELPQAYKNAASVRAQIARYGLGEVIDEVIPYGSIMAGDWEADAPWRKGR
ncbi:RtcB family protein [Bradyrhizobium sp. SZCCHNRI1009]|uniref:RtcB family protein n=1 Tax=Bradyrhizobium sp. SZCCHNRI1009 TaxID=3057277 RepID=UPI00291686A1|nr:RtcB family protein [Bradyrhizobium sp. SZCCHNRI1009]